MNYHIEHHMYAAVPCYNLGRLHRAIRHDLPKSPQGLWAAWRQIVTVLKRQAAEPEYQFMATLPPTPTLQTQD
jgi:fatty acid desaturase